MGFMKRSHRHVDVILNEDVEGIGFAGELLSVKAGFARNFLLATGKADVATPERQAKRQADMVKATARRESEVAQRQKVADKLNAAPVHLSLKTGPGNQVFGSITAADVAKQLKTEHKIELDAKQLHGLPLKQLGRSMVSAKLGLGVVGQVTLEIAGEAAKKTTKTTTQKAKATA